MDAFRTQNEWERALFAFLFERPFPGSVELAKQLRDALVRQIDKEGSLAIESRYREKAAVSHRIPVEAEGEDNDGTTIHFLLHVVDGIAEELEIYKSNGTPIERLPEIEMLRVLHS